MDNLWIIYGLWFIYGLYMDNLWIMVYMIYGLYMDNLWIWLLVSTPLKHISQLGLLFHISGKTKNAPNQQPVMRVPPTNV